MTANIAITLKALDSVATSPTAMSLSRQVCKEVAAELRAAVESGDEKAIQRAYSEASQTYMMHRR